MSTIRIRPMVWFATGAALSLIISLLVLNAWSAQAKPGDDDSTFVPITACRLADTRPAPNRVGTNSTWGPQDARTLQATGANGRCVIPTTAVGLSLNVTALNATQDGFLTFWDSGPLPLAASLNPSPGQPPTPNAVNVPLSAAGSFRVYNENGFVDMVIDVNGYYVKSSLVDLQAQIDLLASGNAVIPSGTTVTGEFTWDHGVVANDQDVIFDVQLPARAPAALADDKVNFGPDSGANYAFDDDPTCTGTAAAPTAPPGKVCIYISSAFNIDLATGFAAPQLQDRNFWIQMQTDSPSVGSDMYLQGTWAYRAP